MVKFSCLLIDFGVKRCFVEYDKKALENNDESDEEKERNDKFSNERKLMNSLNTSDSSQLGRFDVTCRGWLNFVFCFR